MGIDFLDFSFRIEKRLGIKIRKQDTAELDRIVFAKRGHLTPPDVMAGELYDWIAGICRAQDVRVPHSCWNAIRIALAQTTGKPPQRIRRETMIARDLGFS